MSRRQRSAPKVQVSSSVRLGLGSIVEGNESSIRSMLDAGYAHRQPNQCTKAKPMMISP